MIEDNKNNDTKEELKKSSEDNDMNTQQTETQNTEINNNEELKKPSEESDLKTQPTETPSSEITNNENLNESIKDNENDNKENSSVEKNDEKDNEETNDDNPDAKWYVIGAASGFEEKAKQTIVDNARKASLSHFFFDYQIPKQEVVEIKKGKKINSEKNFFPGYMLIKMIMNNQTWQLVKNSNKVSGFVGNENKPIPLSQNEAMKMLKKADNSIEYIAPKYVYEVGQQVKVIDGPFASFNGMVEEVDEERGRLKISVSIFGRSTPVELEYTQVEKM
ncbi:MAG: hypothetical protein CFH27_01107 [Alphaproteobacteria bacterium MarineAlpha6_Bin5]|nr:MAG: hypothetical protein CFH27_01107 [Alphaproteobacteria bacterium MarineAlpha6_Bin5]|tara:strand:- start:1939 stop:2769 length:831 start_codon:yes stop_codon:yes gene_type:complete